ncbi:MAG: pitrilysin family protein [Alphaproteobacteria bacterium]|nr:pitrilysin family protein [Alphaproteobacteria bacterium]
MQPIETFRLKNGMEVVVLPNHRVPAVNHMLWYRIGAADDPQGKSGLAHYHEHLMFKGGKKFATGDYVRLIDKNGGEYNAFTGADATSYYVTIAKDRLPQVMELEADRMRTITVTDDEAAKEKEVIIEERRSRIENSPPALLAEQMSAALFRNHPYHLPIIGWQHEMDGLTKRDVLDFHAKYYHPNNAVLIVSGDITAAELKPLAEKYYGALPRKEIPPRHWLAEPPQIVGRTVTLHHRNVKQPEFSRMYAAPSMVSGDKAQALPLFVLAHLLGGGKNSALYQSLVVEQKIAADIGIDYNFYARGPAAFSIDITPEKDVPLATLEKALDSELAKFLKDGAEPQALDRTKRLMQAEIIYAREGLTSLSNIMGWMIMAGQPAENFNRWPEMIGAVTAGQVVVAARAVLKPEASVTGYLLPEEKP